MIKIRKTKCRYLFNLLKWISRKWTIKVKRINPSQYSNTKYLPRIIVYNIPFLQHYNGSVIHNTNHEKSTTRIPTEAILEESTIVYQYLQNDGNLKENPDICTICLNDYEEYEQVRQLQCLHFFHSECISHWIKTCRMCPNCRLDIVQMWGYHGSINHNLL